MFIAGKLKSFIEYATETRKKEKGTKSGQIVSRQDASKSKQSSWLVKEGGGYDLISVANFAAIASDIHAICESYSGNLYQLFLPNNAPKTRLFSKEGLDQSKSTLLLGSKFIEDFTDLQDFVKQGRTFSDLTPSERQILQKDIVKVRLVAAMLNELDFEDKLENSGFAQQGGQITFKKVDHGESLNVNQQGNTFSTDFSIRLNPYSHLADFINAHQLDADDTLRWQVINEIVQTCQTDSRSLAYIIQSHEALLSQYRNLHGSNTHHLLGESANTISDLITERFTCLRLLNTLKITLDQEHAHFTTLGFDINPIRPLLNEVNNMRVVDRNRIEQISTRLEEILDAYYATQASARTP